MAYLQGIYEVKNKEKYLGKTNPRYLSSYELQVFEFLDTNKHIVKWGSECVIIPYYNPVKQRMARYMVDIYCEYTDANGQYIKELIEIKPSNETVKPKITKKTKRSSAIYQTATYIQNQAKWVAAEKFAKERGMQFKILTENKIFW